MAYRNCKLLALTVLLCMLIGTEKTNALVIRKYFPVHQGNFWNFSRTDKEAFSTWSINGSLWLKNAGRVFIMLQDNNRLLCMREDWEGLRIYGEFGPDGFYLPEQPLLFLPRVIDTDPDAAPIEASASLKFYTDTTGWKNFQHTGTETRQITFHMQGYADITAGSQEFKDCLVIKKTVTNPQGVSTERIWLAPNIGPVKIITEKDRKQNTLCLLSFADRQKEKQESFHLQDYFPLDPDTTWTYQDQNNKLVTVKTKKQEKARLIDAVTTPFEDYTGDVFYYYFDDKGLRLAQTYWASYGGCTAYPPPEQSGLVLPAGLSLGSYHLSLSYPRSYGWPNMVQPGPTRPELQYSSIILATEDVSVPAGQYKDCLKICSFFISDTATIQFESLRIGYLWLAKGQGIVKQEMLTMINCAHPESINSIYDVRFWQLKKVEKSNGAELAKVPAPINN